MKTVYLYDPSTGAYRSTYDAQESPLVPGQFIAPTHSVDVAPTPEPGAWPVWQSGAWVNVPDHRGAVYYLPDGSRHEIAELGIEPPPYALESAPVTVAQLLEALDVERSRRWRAGFPVQIGGGITKWFHSDEFSLTQHLGLKDKARDLLAAGGAMSDAITISGQTVYWSTMDGSPVAITAQLAFDLVSSAGLQQALVFAASQVHRAAINSAEDLSGYDVLANWPAVFGE
ncbi:DUF4376 domain-containing protein [Methylomonas sp. SURF-2]|uniref:DUF4376 domain-containing protein n=1 Tax=Methylomonas subterranea TaxID=2952225 RepID=A0ABT1TCR1_9GAMM|nr:DUF4376 domain-containing protein [Methylomonas sp. SURF-2]MCQ8103235.1 DUF4376 domain-containing protein [Methylomonas sp. SURF-2]